jgi:hypothetical protein
METFRRRVDRSIKALILTAKKGTLTQGGGWDVELGLKVQHWQLQLMKTINRGASGKLNFHLNFLSADIFDQI